MTARARVKLATGSLRPAGPFALQASPAHVVTPPVRGLASVKVNLKFVRDVVGESTVTAGAVVARTVHGFPLSAGFRAVPVTEMG